MTVEEHYIELYSSLVETYGPINDETLTSVIGFSAGGPVSMCQIGNEDIYVTCELSLYPEQQISAERFRFELFSHKCFSEDIARAIFTSIGNLSMRVQLGHSHTVDVSGVSGAGGVSLVALKAFCTSHEGEFGIYEVTWVGRSKTHNKAS